MVEPYEFVGLRSFAVFEPFPTRQAELSRNGAITIRCQSFFILRYLRCILVHYKMIHGQWECLDIWTNNVVKHISLKWGIVTVMVESYKLQLSIPVQENVYKCAIRSCWDGGILRLFVEDLWPRRPYPTIDHPHSKKSEVHPGVSQDNPVLAGSGVRSGRSNNKFKFQHTESDDRRNGYQWVGAIHLF